MCGIVGFTGSKNQELLKSMADSISYRGPDAEGFYATEKINLGQRRLSIIDLEGGKQPMFDAAGKIAVVFNGEIYNYAELKSKYLSDYKFSTNSDTEVIIGMYLKFGNQCVNYFNGMFAFALWDGREDKLFIARDRLGKKPLYFRELNNNLFFASEPKALISGGLPKPAINLSAVSRYFRFQFIPADQSVFEGIEKLLPGHYLVWQEGKKSINKYWELNFENSIEPAVSNLGNLIDDAVKIRLMADVPLGIFLSGGLDSSTIAYYAVKHSAKKVKTFSIGFDDKSFDESKYSALAANFLQTEHYHRQFSEKEVLELIPKIFSLLDEPMADASILPTYLLSAFARKQVTVALGGDGADELFAGYPTFQAHQLADIYAYFPKLLKPQASYLINKLPVSFDNFSLDFKLKRFIKGAGLQGYWRDIEWTAAFNLEEQKDLFNEEVFDRLQTDKQDNFIASFFSLKNDKNSKDALLNFWQKGYLVDDIFVKMDRAAMYNSLEARSPFTDYRLVEFINKMPYNYKIRAFKTKYLFKELMKDKLPKEIVFRKKKGFGIPLSKWFIGPLRDFLIESLSEDNLNQIGLFNYRYVEKLINDHLNKKQDNRIKLWTLLVFVQWHDNFYK